MKRQKYYNRDIIFHISYHNLKQLYHFFQQKNAQDVIFASKQKILRL